jgi:hypothetical protein
VPYLGRPACFFTWFVPISIRSQIWIIRHFIVINDSKSSSYEITDISKVSFLGSCSVSRPADWSIWFEFSISFGQRSSTWFLLLWSVNRDGVSDQGRHSYSVAGNWLSESIIWISTQMNTAGWPSKPNLNLNQIKHCLSSSRSHFLSRFAWSLCFTFSGKLICSAPPLTISENWG